jgi:hypothetical protein
MPGVHIECTTPETSTWEGPPPFPALIGCRAVTAGLGGSLVSSA